MTPAATPTLEDTVTKYLPYLSEIRRRLIFALTILTLGSILGFMYYERIIAWALAALNLSGVNIVFTSPFQYINLAISSGVTVGIILCLPFLLFQLISFLKPALKPAEYRLALAMLPISILLFAFGFVFGVSMMKYVLDLFFRKSVELNIGNFLDISQLLTNIMLTSSLMGLAFQFPIAITIALHFKIITLKFLSRQRPYIYVFALVFASLMPPTDMFSLLLLTLPLVILFEATLLLNRLLVLKRR